MDAVRQIADLLQDPELVLEGDDLGDLALPEVPDRRVAHLYALAGRRHAAIPAAMRPAPDERHGELVPADEHVLDARAQIGKARQPIANPADRPGPPRHGHRWSAGPR